MSFAIAAFAACITALPTSGRAASAVIDPRLARALEHTPASERVEVWVYFTDKGPTSRKATRAPAAPAVSARSLARRARVGASVNAQVTQQDAPLHAAYVARVTARVARVRQRSRWFNALSVEATPAQVRTLRALPEVRALGLVGRFGRAPAAPAAPGAPAVPAAPTERLHRPAGGLDYGQSLWQSEASRIPELHARGLTGKGILIGHFDNGHRLMSHNVFASMQIVAERDFVDHDDDTAPPPEAPSFFGEHGIQTLSVLGGFAPGRLIGPAYGASYALARTENDASETPFEEDNWVAAIEWADSLGCDIVSSSVGYLDFDLPYPSYTWQDMDGNTAVITRAADLAVARGIVVVTAVGNNGAITGGRGNMLVAPADADSAIAVGSAWAPKGPGTEPQWYFTSSVGPTANSPPRTKPDLGAIGAPVYVASAGGTTFYGFNSGSSYACPIVAGVVALLLEAQPQASPLAIRAVLRATASQALAPDNQLGWGVVDAAAALAALESPVAPASMTGVKLRYR